MATKIVCTVSVGKYKNSWDLFVYPAKLPDKQISSPHSNWIARQLKHLKAAVVCVLLTLKKGSLKADKGGDIKIGFSSIFWNTAWTGGQPPHSLGLLVNPRHPALINFPTDSYSNWQWWDAMSHSDAILLDSVATGLQPIVRVIDDWVTARSLGLVFECQVGNGKLVVSGIDLLSNQDTRPEAKQLLYSLKKYMAGAHFNPAKQVNVAKIKSLVIDGQ